MEHNNKIVNLTDPDVDSDAVMKSYVDDEVDDKTMDWGECYMNSNLKSDAEAVGAECDIYL